MRYYPAFHLAPLSGWLNDPNGLSQAGGVYHFFYQYTPDKTQPHPMHWAHATSRDLLRWNHEPVALSPDMEADAEGCWSGTAAALDDGRLALIYTGLSRGGRQTQCLALARDARNLVFEKHSSNPVIEPPEGVPPGEFRDPTLWRHDGMWWVLVGAELRGRGRVIAYSSENLVDWELHGPAATAADGAHMWECPSFFRLDGRDMLVFSPMGAGHVASFSGTFDYCRAAYAPERLHRLDWGPDFYAPQVFTDDRGRRIMSTWMANWPDSLKSPSAMEGWAGALTLPRELSFAPDGALVSRPVEELASLRSGGGLVGEVGVGAGEVVMLETSGDRLDVALRLDAEGMAAARAGVSVLRSPDGAEETRVYFERERGEVVLDRTAGGAGPGGVYSAPAEGAISGGDLDLRVVVDRSTVEVFIGDGRSVISALVFPSRDDSSTAALFAEGGRARFWDVEVWSLYE